MIGVKLTILGIVLLAIFILITNLLLEMGGTAVKLRVALHDPPMWCCLLGNIILFLGIADITGIIYSVVWFLFIK